MTDTRCADRVLRPVLVLPQSAERLLRRAQMQERWHARAQAATGAATGSRVSVTRTERGHHAQAGLVRRQGFSFRYGRRRRRLLLLR